MLRAVPCNLQASCELLQEVSHSKSRARRIGKGCAELTKELSGKPHARHSCLQGKERLHKHLSVHCWGSALQIPSSPVCESEQGLPQHPGDGRWLLPALSVIQWPAWKGKRFQCQVIHQGKEQGFRFSASPHQKTTPFSPVRVPTHLHQLIPSASIPNFRVTSALPRNCFYKQTLRVENDFKPEFLTFRLSTPNLHV